MVSYWWLACIGFVFVAAGVSCDFLDPCPRNRGLPDGLTRAANVIRQRALYRIDMRNAQKGFRPGKVYKFRVQTTYRKLKFNDATVSIEALDGRCDPGSFVIDDDSRYSPKGCPLVVTTQEKRPMGRAYIKWRAPTCGCVHIRARVQSNGNYFLEDADETNGPLARTVCVKDKYAYAVTYPMNKADVSKTEVQDKQMSRTDRLRQLCRIAENGVETNHEFYKRRNISYMDNFQKEMLEIALEQRKVAATQCCQNDEKDALLECFGDVRRRRVDEYCSGRDSAVPIASDRLAWVNQRRRECCWKIGEDRYTCFNYTQFAETMLNDGGRSSEAVTSVSLDEFDPANDVDDYKAPRGEDTVPHSAQQLRPQVMPSLQYTGSKKNIDEEDNDAESRADNDDSNDDDGDSSDVDDVDTGDNDDANKHSSGKPRDQDLEKTTIGADSKDIGSGEHITLTKRVCCNNGARVGATSQRLGRCFHMANKAAEYFGSLWHRQCDRHFVVCCMQVVEGTNIRRHRLKNIDGVPFSYGESPDSEYRGIAY